jgi:hypothetical protein
LFVPGLSTADAMKRISTAIAPIPLDVMTVPNLLLMSTLQERGGGA